MRKKYLSMAIAGALLAGTTTGFAAEAAKAANTMDEYALDEVVVTATRSEKKDVDVPASTVTITAQQIKDSGAKNAADALEKVNGFAYKAAGPMNAAMGTMANELNIRGIDNGTLVLVNGTPISWRGKYDISAIPADSIERIEVVKGGGSVLYGSEAMSGVVNIITKKGAQNQATIGFGNFGQQTYHLNVGDKNFSVTYGLDKWDHLNDVSFGETKLGTTLNSIRDIEKDHLGFTWNINDKFDLLYGYYKAKSTRDYCYDSVKNNKISVGDLDNTKTYMTTQHIGQLHFHDGEWKANAYFNTTNVESYGPVYILNNKKVNLQYGSRESNITYGLDAQKTWHLGEKSTLITGVDMQHEIYHVLPTNSYRTINVKNYMRNNWGIFGQWEQDFDTRNTLILGARETWTTAANQGRNYNDFCVSGQFMHKLNANNNIYLNISQSFIMPTFAQMYGSAAASIPNPNLNPQKGINYEIGWKRLAGNHSWKAALFHMTIKDNISANWEGTNFTYTNEEFKNTGIELSCDIAGKDGLSYNYGLTWQNPQSKTTMSNGKVGKDYWDRKFGRIQLTGGITYHKNKWRTALTASYLADRVQTPSSAHSFASKPYLLTTLTASYAPDAMSEFTLTIDNLLDRHDNTSYSSATYYNAPINYMLSYTQKF